MKVVAFKNTTEWHEYTAGKMVGGVLQEFNLQDAGYVRVDVVEKRKVLSTDSQVGVGVELSGSTLRIQWGLLDVEGRSKPTIYVYKSGDTKGQVLYGPGKDLEIELFMQDDERPLS